LALRAVGPLNNQAASSVRHSLPLVVTRLRANLTDKERGKVRSYSVGVRLGRDAVALGRGTVGNLYRGKKSVTETSASLSCCTLLCTSFVDEWCKVHLHWS
jgi:hypothetical protein